MPASQTQARIPKGFADLPSGVSTQIKDGSMDDIEVFIFNLSDATVYLAFTADEEAELRTGVPLLPESGITTTYGGAIQGIHNGVGTKRLTVVAV